MAKNQTSLVCFLIAAIIVLILCNQLFRKGTFAKYPGNKRIETLSDSKIYPSNQTCWPPQTYSTYNGCIKYP